MVRARGRAIVLGSLALSGCSGASLPKLPKVELPIAAYSEEPSEIYTRIARGAMSCWFGASGPLKRAYVFHADVAPPSANAGAEIVIHERDSTNPSPLGLRAYRVLIKRVPEGTAVAGENLKMPEPLGTAMTQDVQRWASDKTECSPALPQGGLVTAVQNGNAPKATTPVATGTIKSR